MKAFILLADAAAAHPDGTFSVLRGGINIVNVPPAKPITFQGAAVVRVVGSLAEAGSHDLRIRIVNDEGQSIIPDINLKVMLPQGGGSIQVISPFNFQLPTYGKYTFSVAVDRNELDSWPVTAQILAKS